MYEAHEHKCESGQVSCFLANRKLVTFQPDMQPVPISPEAIKAEICFYRYMNAHFLIAENFRRTSSALPDQNRLVSTFFTQTSSCKKILF